MIPKIVHRIWFGTNPIPAQYDEWWKGWQRQLPDYEFITWDDSHIEKLASAPLIREADSMAKRADIARYEIMYEYGGTYLDCDFMPMNYFNFSGQDADFIICHESENDEINCSNGFFSIRKNHPIMRRAMDWVGPNNSQAGEVISATGPGFFGRLLNTVQHKRMPSRSFYPYLYNEPFLDIYSRDLDNTYGIHVWHNSWFNDELRLRKINSMVLEGSLFEMTRLWNEMGPLQSQAGHVPQMIEKLRSARLTMLELAMTSVLSSQIDRSPRPEFELFKACHFLLSKNSNTLVWQIGAGDGLTEDPLRPVLINFDPPTLLVEANPLLTATLQANYSRNSRCQIVNGAVGAQAGTAHLYAINPTLLRQNGGTDAQLNMSSEFSDPRAALGVACREEFTRNHLLKCMELAEVPKIEFATLRNICGGHEPDILVINIGGVEDELVVSAIQQGLRPRIMRFNTRNMAEETLAHVRQTLRGQYEMFDFDGYTMAFRSDFLVMYCSELYVEHGLPTVFGKALGIAAATVSVKQ